MCHLTLFLPIVALPVLWLLPSGISVPLYAALVVLAVWACWLALEAMRLKGGGHAHLAQPLEHVVAATP